MRKTLGILLLLSTFTIYDTFAQRYGTAAGIRTNRNMVGLSLQQRIFPKTTIESMLTFNVNEWAFTTLYEYHHPILFKSFNYYIGAGAHIGSFYKGSWKIGPDVILGVEYKLPIVPLTISADIKPATHLGQDKWFEMQGGLSARYVLVTHRDIKKRKKRKAKARKQQERQEQGKKNIRDIFKKPEPEPPAKKGLFKKPPPPPPAKKGLFKKQQEPPPPPPKKGLFRKQQEPPPPPPKKGLFRKQQEPPPPPPKKGLFRKQQELPPPPPPKKGLKGLFKKQEETPPAPTTKKKKGIFKRLS